MYTIFVGTLGPLIRALVDETSLRNARSSTICRTKSIKLTETTNGRAKFFDMMSEVAGNVKQMSHSLFEGDVCTDTQYSHQIMDVVTARSTSRSSSITN